MFADFADDAFRFYRGFQDAAEAAAAAMVFAVLLYLMAKFVLALGPLVLMWIAGAPTWVILMLLFGYA